MSGDFTIYRVPSLQKVGCTRNFKKRCKERYPGREIIVLEIIPAEQGAKFAGDVEWCYAVQFGYKRSNHYLNTWDFKLTKKQRREYARRGHLGWTEEGRARILAAVKLKIPKGFATMDSNVAQRIAVKGARANGRSPNNAFRQSLTCPRCGKVGNGGNMQRWHFDNCARR